MQILSIQSSCQFIRFRLRAYQKQEHCLAQEAIAVSTEAEASTARDSATRYPKLTADQASHREMNTYIHQMIPSCVLGVEM